MAKTKAQKDYARLRDNLMRAIRYRESKTGALYKIELKEPVPVNPSGAELVRARNYIKSIMPKRGGANFAFSDAVTVTNVRTKNILDSRQFFKAERIIETLGARKKSRAEARNKKFAKEISEGTFVEEAVSETDELFFNPGDNRALKLFIEGRKGLFGDAGGIEGYEKTTRLTQRGHYIGFSAADSQLVENFLRVVDNYDTPYREIVYTRIAVLGTRETADRLIALVNTTKKNDPFNPTEWWDSKGLSTGADKLENMYKVFEALGIDIGKATLYALDFEREDKTFMDATEEDIKQYFGW